MTKSESNDLLANLHPGKRIYVAAWWRNGNAATLCEIISIDTDKYCTVRPLEGNSHSRWVKVQDIIS